MSGDWIGGLLHVAYWYEWSRSSALIVLSHQISTYILHKISTQPLCLLYEKTMFYIHISTQMYKGPDHLAQVKIA